MQTPVVSLLGRSVHGQSCATVSIHGYIFFLNFAGYNRDMRGISTQEIDTEKDGLMG